MRFTPFAASYCPCSMAVLIVSTAVVYMPSMLLLIMFATLFFANVAILFGIYDFIGEIKKYSLTLHCEVRRL